METLTFSEHIGITTGQDDQIDYLIEVLYKSRSEEHELRTARNGWQVRDVLNTSVTMHNIVPMIYKRVGEYLEVYEPNQEMMFGINNIWGNILPPGGYNIMHDHPGCQLTCVWWLQAEENSGDLLVQNPCPSSRLRDYSAMRSIDTLHRIKPERNKMVFFNSQLCHLVDANNSDSDRISISLNIDLANPRTGTRSGLPVAKVV